MGLMLRIITGRINYTENHQQWHYAKKQLGTDERVGVKTCDWRGVEG